MDDTTANNLHDDDVSAILENLSVCKSLVKSSAVVTTAIRLQTTGFEIVAECALHGERMSDVLNQQISDYLECSNAVIFRGGKKIEEVKQIKIRKPEIMIAGIVGDIHEAQQKRIGSHRTLLVHQAFVAVDRWIVKGRLFMTSNKTVKEFLQANRDYFPIADAEVIDAESPDSPKRMPVAIVNRSRVSFMDITELEAPTSDLSPYNTLLKNN